VIRNLVLGSVLVLSTFFGGCGYEPPTPGEVMVTSEPAGAAISLDGRPTDQVTPAVLDDLDGGLYQISVDLEDIVFRPAQKEIEIFYGTRSNLHFETGTGSLLVTSTPPSARIWLDGAATDHTTPHTFTDVDPGDYTVDLQLAHHRNEAGPQTVTVSRNQETTVDLELVIGTVMLFEGFSNVSCTGCPAMLNNIHYLMHDAGYGFDRLLFIKYAGSNPNGLDPMYLSNTSMVRNRAQYYTGVQTPSLPSLVVQGTLVGSLGTPPDAAGLQQLVDTSHVAPVTFYLTVTAPQLSDLAVRDVDCEIVLHAPVDGVDLAGHQLRAVLLYSEVHTADEYNPGGDEYHWVARRDAEVVSSIGEIAPGSTTVFNITLNDPDPSQPPLVNLTPLGREVIVFIQNNSTKAVIQAGSSMMSASDPTPRPRLVNPGGSR